MCADCKALGFSSFDVRTYRCAGCGIKGHRKFRFENERKKGRSETDLRAGLLICVDCTGQIKSIRMKIRSKGSFRCSCPGKLKDMWRHLPNNENCKLNRSIKGKERWPGMNKGVSRSEWKLLERCKHTIDEEHSREGTKADV